MSIVRRIDGISIALNHVAKIVETIYGVVNVNMFAMYVNDVAFIDGIREANMDFLYGLVCRTVADTL